FSLAESMLFLGESYIYGRPTDCFCNSPEEMAPDRIAKYYETHLKKFIREIAQKAQKQGVKKKETEEKEKATKEQAKQQALKQKIEQVIAKINSALNQEPKLTNNELSPEYQNWESQINQITDIQQITNFQARILADIRARRHDKKTTQKETEKSYQENKAEAENLKKEKAAENPQEYSKEAKQKIEKKLKNHGVKE
ncbi:6425_t:CDS:2, partial [Funneliformis geosporum]